jgi:hypothetical protein
MNKFINDLNTGKYYETLFLNHIKFKDYERPDGYFKEYDIKVYKNNGGISTYEVKSDKQINIYGNICIEYMCKNKPSGIITSTAKYWAIFEPKGDQYALYKIPSKIIRDYIENKKYKRLCKGGDNKASRLVIFDKNLFKDYIIYNNIDGYN